MENFSELIKNRRSMRKFTDEELTQDEVVTLMKAALMSPSSKRSNSWQFVVIDDKEMLKELSHCTTGTPKRRENPGWHSWKQKRKKKPVSGI